MGKSRAGLQHRRERLGQARARRWRFFSLEMSEAELAQRFIASQARISGDRLRKGKVAEKDWPKVVRACNELEQAPLWIDDSSDLGHARPARKGAPAARPGAERRTAGSGLVIVDYMQLMRADDPRANRVEQVGQISRGLKILARELEVPVIGDLPALARPRAASRQAADPLRPARVGRDRAGRRPRRLPLPRRVLQPRQTEDRAIAELIIAKHRNGPIGTVKLVFLEPLPKFADHAPRRAAGRAARRRGRRRSTTRRRRRLRAQMTAAREREAAASPPARSASATARAGSSAPRTSPGPASAASGAIARARAPRRRLGDPAAVPRRLLRPPAGDRDGRDPRGRRRRARATSRSSTSASTRAAACGSRRRRHRQDDAGDARLEDRARGRALGRDLLAAEAAGADPPHLRRRARRATPTSSFFERLTSVDLLHIDDLGAEKRSDWVLEQLYALVNERYEASARSSSPPTSTRRELEEQIGAAHGLAPGRDLRRPVPLFGADQRSAPPERAAAAPLPELPP